MNRQACTPEQVRPARAVWPHLILSAAAIARITHSPTCPQLAAWRHVADRLEEAADPSSAGHEDALNAALVVLGGITEPAELNPSPAEARGIHEGD